MPNAASLYTQNPGGVVGHRMVQPAAEVDRPVDLAMGDRPGRRHRPAGDQSGVLGLDDRTDRHAGLVSTTGNDGYQNLRNSTRTVNYLAASVAQSDDHRATVRSCVSSDRQIMRIERPSDHA